jgi:hypothetical protein
MTPENLAPIGLALLGLLLGMRHATDPDHVIAVTTILSSERRLGTASRIGVIWGLGHTLTVLAVGAAIIIFKLNVPVRLGLAMEFAVALVLIMLGFSAATILVSNTLARLGLARKTGGDTLVVHTHHHSHGGEMHSHGHVHAHQPPHKIPSTDAHHDHRLPAALFPGFSARRPLLKSFGVGIVHGLAGSAAIALLVLSAIPNPLWATLYLAVFCLGTVLGMALITTLIGAPFVYASARMARFHRGLALGAGALSFGFGLFLAYQISVADQLFGSGPIWLPH